MGGKKFGKYKFLSRTSEYNIAALEVIQQFKTKQKLLPTRVKTSRVTGMVSYRKLKNVATVGGQQLSKSSFYILLSDFLFEIQ